MGSSDAHKIPQPSPLTPNMKKPLISLLLLSSLSQFASAAVTLNFDATTDGFAAGSDASSMVWSSQGGGSLALTAASGWKPQTATLNIQDNPALKAELDDALVRGGTLSYTVTVETTAIAGGTPDWFEGIHINNSTGGWDQQCCPAQGQFGLYAADFPLAAVRTFDISYPILAGTGVGDTNAQFGAGTPWAQVHLGINSGGTFTTGTVYIDTFTIAANPIPEPTPALLGLLSLAALHRRRR